MIINIYTSYGVVFMRAIANDVARPVSPPILAKKLGLSPSLMAQAAYKLKKAGLVRSRRGPGGGYVKGLSPRPVTFDLVAKAMTDCTHDVHRLITPARAAEHVELSESYHLINFAQTAIFTGLKDIIV